jgi:hypothetical protein
VDTTKASIGENAEGQEQEVESNQGGRVEDTEVQEPEVDTTKASIGEDAEG